MEKVNLSNAGFEVSRIGLGCMSLSGNLAKDKSIMDAAVASGITLFDTADLYQKGLNEEVVGEVLRVRRKEVVLATKVGNQWKKDGSGSEWNPRKAYILKAVEDSLIRLKTDYIDLYQLHGVTLEDPWEETLDAFELLIKQGKIRAFGISSIRPNVIRKVMAMKAPATIMMQYSPLDRRPEEAVFPFVESTGTKVLVRGAFAKGLLIDKSEAEFLDWTPSQVASIRDRIDTAGFSPEAVLIRFGLSQKAVGSLIIGASTVAQIERIHHGFEESSHIPEEVISRLQSQIPVNHYQAHR